MHPAFPIRQEQLHQDFQSELQVGWAVSTELSALFCFSFRGRPVEGSQGNDPSQREGVGGEWTFPWSHHRGKLRNAAKTCEP